MTDATVVDMKEEEEGEGGFTFPDFHDSGQHLGIAVTGSIDSEEEAGDGEELLGKSHHPSSSSSSSSSSSWISFLTLDYYQGFFDVTTTQVVRRVVAGVVPVRPGLVAVLRPKPDLYGPFWLCMTLIFSTAISGNLSRAFDAGWEFHFHEVTVLGAVVYGYTWLLPCCWWALLWGRGARDRLSLLELMAIYGYCIAVFIPITLVWVIPSEVLRWLLLALGAGLSGAVLVRSLWQPLQAESRRLVVVLLLLAFLMHSGMAVGFKFFYFNSALSPELSTNSTPELDMSVLHDINSTMDR